MILLTHLWQSTICVALAALLGVVLSRAAPARTHHTIWLFASLKFLVPFSALVIAGSYLAPWTSSLATPQVSVAVRWLERSFSLWTLDAAAGSVGAGFSTAGQTRILWALALVWISGILGLIAWRASQWRALMKLSGTATPLVDGREAEALERVSQKAPRSRAIELLQSRATFEPGVLGVFRPRLLWPAGLSDRLNDAQLEAIVAHEVCHVDRRDNLAAAVQMVVETVFWFHPVVWWVGARLVRERERACDEEVLRMGTDTRSYAEGILEVCGFCLRSPAAFVAGVGSSHLSQRIERILRRRRAASTPPAARLLLVAVALLAVGAPMAAGMMRPVGSPVAASPQSTSGQEERQVLRPGNGVTSPKLVYEVKPRYTRAAMDAKIQGSVWLEAIVLENGEVGDVTVTRSLDTEYGLDDEAVKALRQWRFEPATKDGKPVAVQVDIEMSFKLK
jgi:bla regulator protein blaR1